MSRTQLSSIDQKYKRWITENVQNDDYGQCAEITQAMAITFPELQRIRGHYYCIHWGERTHWWLITSNNEIIDPTDTQFPSKGHGVYQPWIEGSKEPYGRCPNCGELFYDPGYCCSENCHIEYVAYCNNPL